MPSTQGPYRTQRGLSESPSGKLLTLTLAKRDNGRELCARASTELETQARSPSGEWHLPSLSLFLPSHLLLVAPAGQIQLKSEERGAPTGITFLDTKQSRDAWTMNRGGWENGRSPAQVDTWNSKTWLTS